MENTSPTEYELYTKVMNEMWEKHHLKINQKDVKNVIFDFFRTVRKLISKVTIKEDKLNPERIRIPFLGSFIFNRSRLAKRLHGTYKIEKEYRNWYHYIRGYGWSYLGYFRAKGFVFINVFTEKIYKLWEPDILNLNDAMHRFYDMVRRNSEEKWAIKLILTPMQLNIGYSVRKYNTKGNLIKEFPSVFAACEEDYLEYDALSYFVDLNRKRNMKGIALAKLRGAYYLPHNDTINSALAANNESLIFSALNKYTYEVEYEDIGNVHESIWFIMTYKGRGTRTLKTSVLYRAIKYDMIAYGFRWKARTCGTSDNEEDKRD